MTKPLQGLLVVAVEQAVAAPLCTARLAQAGARVIKVERPQGDFARGYDTAAGGASSYFTWANQGKESVVLDFHDPSDAEILAGIIAKADVFVQNLAPGALARAGFASDDLRARHPKLITLDISGYGEAPEVAHLKAYDLLIQAEAGLIGISGGETELGRIGVSVCDIGAGMSAHAGILEAVLRRSITGQGAGLAVSLFDVAADWMTVPLIHAEYGTGAPRRVGLRHPSIAPYGAFATQDGDLTLISIQNDREWGRFCDVVLSQPQAASDPRFAINADRVANRDALELLINAIVSQLSKTAFRDRLQLAGIAFGAVNTVADLAEHPALRRQRVVADTGAALDIPAPPVRWSEPDQSTPLTPAPKIGAHTKAIKEEFSP